MAANRLRLTSLNLLHKYHACSAYRVRKSLYCTKKSGNEESSSEDASGFTKFDKKQTELLKESEETPGKESSELSSTAISENEEPTSENASRFLKFDKKQTEFLKELGITKESSATAKEEPFEPFVSLLKKSNFIAMGDPVGKVVIGTIYHVVGKDLYIDFGWKFPCVCTAPERNAEFYVVGSKVKLLVKDLELSAKFLGGEEYITLCEADCVLLGLLNPPRTKVAGSVSTS